MEWSDTALVLSLGKFKEADLWVRLLSPGQGMITAFAFGGSKSRRRFTGCLDVFNLIRASTVTSRNGAFINMTEATLLEGPRRLRLDWQRQGLAANCIRFLEALGVPPGAGELSFNLTRSTLSLLEHSEELTPILPLLFRFRMVSDQGYSPDLLHCSQCGRELSQGRTFFKVAEGLALCSQCGRAGTMSLELDPETLDLLRKVQEYSPESWTQVSLSPEQWRQAGRLVDAFVQYHLGLEWRNGRFVR